MTSRVTGPGLLDFAKVLLLISTMLASGSVPEEAEVFLQVRLVVGNGYGCASARVFCAMKGMASESTMVATYQNINFIDQVARTPSFYTVTVLL